MVNSDKWKILFDSPAPQDEALPHPYNQTLDLFQKIVVIKNLRSDKVIPAIQNYVSTTMG
jgi:dynein heavy chain